MTAAFEKVVRERLVVNYCKCQYDQCDMILDAVQRLSKYDEESPTQYLDILKDFYELRREGIKGTETINQMIGDPAGVTDDDTSQALSWLIDVLGEADYEDKPAMEHLQHEITNGQKKVTAYDLLFTKIQGELNQYRRWLMTLPVEKVIKHSHKYDIRDGIAMSFEDDSILTEKEAQALLEYDDPLSDIFERYQEKDSSYMETIREAIKEYAQDAVNLYDKDK